MAKTTLTIEDTEDGVSVNIELKSDPPFDEKKGYTIAQNLIGNAFKFITDQSEDEDEDE